MTPSGIEPTTFRFVVQLRHRGPWVKMGDVKTFSALQSSYRCLTGSFWRNKEPSGSAGGIMLSSEEGFWYLEFVQLYMYEYGDVEI
jgi:hypothetical protein